MAWSRQSCKWTCVGSQSLEVVSQMSELKRTRLKSHEALNSTPKPEPGFERLLLLAFLVSVSAVSHLGILGMGSVGRKAQGSR